MTVVAVWFEANDGVLWAVADTRITSTSTPVQGVYVRTNSAAKLLSLPVACRALSHDPNCELPPYYETNYGFAFAGNPVPALNSFVTASSILQQLTSAIKAMPPSAQQVAEIVNGVVNNYLSEAWSNDRVYPGFEYCIFGHCPINNCFEIYHMTTKPGALSADINQTRILPRTQDKIVVIGSGQERFEVERSRIMNDGDEFGRTGRYPKLAIEAIVRSEVAMDVGGSLSIGIASRRRFQHYAWVSPIEPGKSAAKITINGLEIDKWIPLPAQFFIGTQGMV
jgi:hypothetical protein